jgi:uncharacterized membrane protein
MSNEMVLALNARIQQARMACVISLVLLIFTCIGWEWFLAPLRSGGSWMVLKALPLVAILPSIVKGRRYTYQYSSMLILFYFTEGVMRLFDADALSRMCAGLKCCSV